MYVYGRGFLFERLTEIQLQMIHSFPDSTVQFLNKKAGFNFNADEPSAYQDRSAIEIQMVIRRHSKAKFYSFFATTLRFEGDQMEHWKKDEAPHLDLPWTGIPTFKRAIPNPEWWTGLARFQERMLVLFPDVLLALDSRSTGDYRSIGDYRSTEDYTENLRIRVVLTRHKIFERAFVFQPTALAYHKSTTGYWESWIRDIAAELARDIFLEGRELNA